MDTQKFQIWDASQIFRGRGRTILSYADIYLFFTKTIQHIFLIFALILFCSNFSIFYNATFESCDCWTSGTEPDSIGDSILLYVLS